MALTLAIPPTSPAGSSPASDDSHLLPHTPISPSVQTVALSASDLNSSIANANPPAKRKASRRANTAERRATHNAVERQRRETLNGRFLDLAGLLPNLSQIRRPSKSSIVNSSIAYIHVSRRHRLLAARELRLVKLEADALRRELNEWRGRAGHPQLEEPVRSEGFSMVLSGELEAITAVPDDDDEAGGHGYDGYDEFEDDYSQPVVPQLAVSDGDERLSQGATRAQNVNANHFNIVRPEVGIHDSDILPRLSRVPMIAPISTSIPFENPAMPSPYEQAFNGAMFMQPPSQDIDKVAWNNAQVFASNQQQLRSFLNPPVSAHPTSASGNGAINPFTDAAGQGLLASLQRQHQQQLAAIHAQQQAHIYSSPDRDDASSVGSGRSIRSRDGSMGNSGYCTPLESPTSFEMAPAHYGGGGDFAVPRRMTSGEFVGNSDAWYRAGDVAGMQQTPISVGGLGNSFLMTM